MDIEAMKNFCNYILSGGNNICRLCFKVESEFVDAYDSHILENDDVSDRISLYEILRKMTNKAVEMEELPHTFCVKCCEDLLQFYIFTLKCQRQEKVLNKVIEIMTENSVLTLKNAHQKSEIYLLTFEPVDNEVKDETFGDDLISCNNFQTKSNCRKRICPHCSEEFNLKQQLRNHCKEVHNSMLRSCKICEKIFISKSEFNEHKLKKCKVESLNCPLCFKQFSDLMMFRQHSKNVHMNKVFTCTQCSSMFGSEKLLALHNRRSHRKSCVCETCGKTFSTKNLLKLHEDSHLEKICDQCGAIYKSSKSFQRHSLICKQLADLKDFKKNYVTPVPQTHKLYGIDLKYSCDYCKTEYQQKESLAYHIKKQHLYPGSYSCKICGKSFNLSRNLNVHMKVHSGEKSEQCPTCFNYFVNKMALKYHMRLHSGERPYPCTMCDERFLSSSRRMFHMRKKHWGPQLECNVCLKKYHTPYDLKKHMHRHSNPKSRLFLTIDNNSKETENL